MRVDYYFLRLSLGTRKAITWVGHRYAHGDQLFDLLTDPDVPWYSEAGQREDLEDAFDYPFEDYEKAIRFRLTEKQAAVILKLMHEDGLACFADCAKNELYELEREVMKRERARLYPSFDDYLTCALWSSTHFEDENDQHGTPMDQVDALVATETKDKMNSDLVAFMEAAEKIYDEKDWDEIPSQQQAAHDFWLTRNGHGAGFWDRGLGELGDRLTKLAESFGECDIYVGDDGMIYI